MDSPTSSQGQAALRAGATRRINECAATQAFVCGLAYLSGIAFAWLHEYSLRSVWQRVQSLEARCAWPQSTLLDQHCLLALYSS